ncbi:ankyrin unc44 [Grosmannia clavigera kw1407]|uniref:Ankyrin unc44 n=1 Tax=Grosmannia clavigera (strain kw1407 / UAMH 11150) TaxID=655863 RepID=F0XEL8_GROCL|nr:ankyrin unc44 [Grosmannia clavigera kw1407]EFX03589.1 ankyrin unc44 [Grosmannia clavigera kw1407]
MALTYNKTFSLTLVPDGGTVKTDINTSLGDIVGSTFTVDFQTLYEVHGGYDPGDKDNASLLVIKIIPMPRDVNKQFSNFTVSLSVEAFAGEEDSKVHVVSFEPASLGSEYVGVYTKDHERQRVAQLSGQVPIMATAAAGIQLSSTDTTKYSTTHQLSVTGTADRSDCYPYIDVKNRVSWQVRAASQEQGIGDSLTVAILVKRPCNAKFQLVGQVEGRVGGVSAATRRFLGKLAPYRRDPKILAIFPLDRRNTPMPPDVLADNLHRASTGNALRRLTEVGVHLAEKTEPVKLLRELPASSTHLPSAESEETSVNSTIPEKEEERTHSADSSVVPSKETILTAATHVSTTTTDTAEAPALSLAKIAAKYNDISGNTTLTVLYETPTWPTQDMSWEALANRLMLVPGRDEFFTLSWLHTTAEMIEVVCTKFASSEKLYRTICVPSSIETSPDATAKEREKKEENKTLGSCIRPLLRSMSFRPDVDTQDENNENVDMISREEELLLKRIFRVMIAPSNPGTRLIKCLQTLMPAHMHQHETPSPRFGSSADEKVCSILDDNPHFRNWQERNHGSLKIVMLEEDDSSLVFAKLHETQNTVGCERKSLAILDYVFDNQRCKQSSGSDMLASLCYQILCLKPRLFEHVDSLVEHIFNQGMSRENRHFILLQSLLSCPEHGNTVCIIRALPDTTIPSEALARLFTLASQEDRTLKLVTVSNAGTFGLPECPTVYLQQETIDFGTIADEELGALMRKQFAFRDNPSMILRDGLIRHYEKEPILFSGTPEGTGEVIRAWVELAIRIARPISAASLKKSMPLIPNKKEEIYRDILGQTPSADRDLLRQVLPWMALAQAPLGIAEISAALAIENGASSMNEMRENMPINLLGDIESSLGCIVRTTKLKVPTLPRAFRDFLTTKQGHGSDKEEGGTLSASICAGGDMQLAQTCLEFLSLHRDQDPSSLANAADQHPLLKYATQHWPEHYANGRMALIKEQETYDMPPGIARLFHNGELITFWARLYSYLENSGVECGPISALGIASEVGCIDLVDILLREELTTEDISSSLFAAIRRGDVELLDRIMEATDDTSACLHGVAVYGKEQLLHRFKASAVEKDHLNAKDRHGFSPLHHACMGGMLEIVKELLDRGAETNTPGGPRDVTPLHCACFCGHDAVIGCLGRWPGVDVNATDTWGQTPLHHACKGQQPDAVRALLRFPAVDISAVSEEKKETALLLAATAGRTDIIDLLLPAYGEINMAKELSAQDGLGCTALHCAAKGGHLGAVKKLLRCNVSQDRIVSVGDNAGNWPIHLASKFGHTEVVQVLLEEADNSKQIESLEDDDMTPLHKAVLSNHKDVVALLLEHHEKKKVPLDVSDWYSRCSLHYAASLGYDDITRLLVKGGATLDVVDEDGETPLLKACKSGHDAVVDYLVAEGADVTLESQHGLTPLLAAAMGGSKTIMGRIASCRNVSLTTKDARGRNALHHAASSGNEASVSYALTLKIDPAEKDAGGRTALSIAAGSGHLEVVRRVVQSTPTGMEGADNGGNTPLFYASSNGHLGVVAFLLDNTRDLDLMNKENKGPLHAAVLANHEEIVKYLLQAGACPNTKVTGTLSTPLHFAVVHAGPAIVECLARADGVEGEVLDSEGVTPIFKAALYGKSDAVSKLIDANWHGNFKQGKWMWYPLHAAYQNTEAIEQLVTRAQMSLSSPDTDGDTVLHLATQWAPQSVSLLLKLGSDPLLKNKSCSTPLHLAAKRCDVDVFTMILDKAKEMHPEEMACMENLRDNMDHTVLLSAVSSGMTPTIQLLLNSGRFDLNDRDSSGDSALNLAAKAGKPEVIDTLLDKKPDAWDPTCLRRALLALKPSDGDRSQHVACRMVQLLSNVTAAENKPEKFWADDLLLKDAMSENNTFLIRLFLHERGDDLAGWKDIHGWTPVEVLEAFDEDTQDMAARSSTDGDGQALPSEWDLQNSSPNCVVIHGPSEQAETAVQVKSEATGDQFSVMFGNHPVPHKTTFAFSVEVVRLGKSYVGVGVGHRGGPLNIMPGWTDDTWGMHSDDGNLYNSGRVFRKELGATYGTGDIITVFVDTLEGTMSFLKNGELIDPIFTNIHGRVYPMVAIGPGAEIKAVFTGISGIDDPYNDADE